MKTTNAIKRLFSFLLALMLVLSIIPQLSLPVSAFALEIKDADSTIDGAFEYLGPVILCVKFGNANQHFLTATVSYPYTGKTWTISDTSNSLAYIDLSDAFTAETFPSVDSPVEQRTFHVKANYEGETLEKDYVFAVKPSTAFQNSHKYTVSPEEWTYSGGIPEVTLVNTKTVYGDKVLVEGVDFTLENQYGNNNTGWNEYLFTGIGNYAGSFVELIRINPTTEIPDIRVEKEAVHYDGTAKTPGVIVTFHGNPVDSYNDYKLSYSNNVEPGTATVTITGRYNFDYTTTRTFQIQDHIWVNECCGTDLQCQDCNATKENEHTKHEFSNSTCIHCGYVCQNHRYGSDLKCTVCGSEMENYVGVNDITLNIGSSVPANRDVFVTATAYPEDRTGKDVVFTYEIEEDNGATANVGGSDLQSTHLIAYNGGTFKMKVTADDGYTTFSKTFTIHSVYTPVTAVDGTVPTEAEVGQIILPTEFLPKEVSSDYALAWEVMSGPATVQGNILTLTDVGTVNLRAYVINGLSWGQPFIQEYTIQAKPAQTVLPMEVRINDGNIIISEHSETELKVEYGGSKEAIITKDTPVQITGASTYNYTITVNSGAPKIILRDVNIRNYSANPILIESGASADITLLGSSTLNASFGGKGLASLGVPEGAAVTIGGSGALTVLGGGNAAGIGGISECNSGTITINGGTINATGGEYGAGIGSGEKSTAGTITINGGNVTAQGGDSAAGMGGGNGGVASVVIINGGTVNATGGKYGPGIGSGNDRNKTNSNPAQITITGGTVTARGGSEGAGIGGGCYRPGATVTITDGNVTAIGGYTGAGIGGGKSSLGGNVTISGGIVSATGGEYGAGIGSGEYNYPNSDATGGSVTISGGTITAAGGKQSAGIGGGRNCPGGNVVITGGNVKTSYGQWAKGIGRGDSGYDDGTLTNGTDPVTLQAITLVGMTEQSTITSVTGIGSYGLGDVRTLDTNKLYFYLPADVAAATITAGNESYYFCKDTSGNYYTSHGWSNNDGVCAHCGETCDHEGEENICSICGKLLHVHDWEYTAAGNTITAKCRNADTCSLPEQSITILAAGKTYDGTAVTATLTGSIEGVESPAISYSGNTDAGLHTASIQLDGQKAMVSFEIEAAIPTVVWDNTSASVDYTGSAAVITAPVVTLVNNETYSGTIHYSYTGTSNGNGLPTHAGSYTVTASVAANGNYTAATSTNTLQLTIHKIDPMYTIPTGLAAIYGDTLADVQLPEGFAWEDAKTTSVGNVGNNNFDVTYTPKDTVNYNTVTGISVGIEVGKAASSMIKVPSANELTYNGSEQTLIVTGSTNDGRLVYSLAADGAYSEVLPKATDAGTYHVWYKVIGDSNHTDTEPASVTAEIKQRPVTVTATDASKTYGDTDPAELTWAVTSGSVVPGEKLAIEIDRADGENTGAYTVTVSQAEGANKNYDITFVNGTFTINKAALTITAEDKTAIYGDKAPQYTVMGSGFKNGESLEYLGGTLAFACDYAQFCDKGAYSITPSGYESANYEITYVPGTLTVSSKTITVTIADKTSVYGEAIAELTATADGIVNNDTNIYSLATTATSTADVGIYPITGIALDDNYTITFENGTYTITKAPAVATAPTAVSGLVYNTDSQTLIAAGSTNDGTIVYALEKEGEYTAQLPKATDAGTYHVWYKVIGDGNHTDSDPASVAVKIAKADPGIGAVTAAVVNDTLETSAIVLTRANTTVQGALTVDAGQALALGGNTIRYTFTPTDGANYLVVTGEVNVTVADTIAPTGTVTISTESWTEFLNNITFGLFFKETQTVSVTAEDNLSGVAKIEYIESKTAMDLAAVQAATQWTEMKNGSVSVTLEDAKQFVYYIRITDKSGNVSYLSSDGAEYDTIAPVIEGVDNGVSYYTTQAITVTDKNMDTITLNGKTATDFITLEGNKEATYTIVATDKAGNSTTVTVKMAPIADIAEFMDDKSNANVTSDDKSNLQTILDTASELLKDGDMTAGEKAELEKVKSRAEELIQIIENTAAQQKAVADQAAEFDEDTVKSIHKAELEKLADNIDALLDTDNLTRDERAALETLLEQVEDMIHTINKVAADSKIAKDTVDAYDPATVKSTDKASIETALDTIKNLLGTKHLTVAEREALEKAKADAEALLEAIEEAAKAADTDNTAKVEDVTADNVTPEDKSDLEKARDDLKNALENYSDNYTEEEKKAIGDEIQRIEDAIEVIENVESVEDAVSDLPSTVEPDEEETVAKIEEAKKAYDQLTDYEKSLVDEKVKEKLDELTAAAVDYEIVKGDAGTWSKGSTSGLPFSANGSFSKFVCVEIDGNVIDAQHYTAEAGGTVITLNAAYLETLSTGEHTITIVYTDGEAEGSFVIDAESAVSTTGNGSNIMLYGIVFAVGLAVLLVLILIFKKRKQTD